MYHDNTSGCEQTSAPKNSGTSSTSSATLKRDSAFSSHSRSSGKRLTDRHYRHCCGNDFHNLERGLNPDWIKANCYSVSAQVATQHLHYSAKSPGIIIEGANGQFQFKPDRPWRSPEDKEKKRKAPKYRTAKGDEYDALLPRHPDNPHYWLDLEALKQACWQIDGVPHLLVTEGGFKAICLNSEGIPTIGLLGVEMGLTSSQLDPQGKRYLVQSLESYAKAGFGFILGFDADISFKEAVRNALYKLGFQLQKLNASVYVMPQWDEKLGKGIDDFIVNQGIEEFRELLIRSVTFEQWADQQKKEGKKLSPIQRAWEIILKQYTDRLRFNQLTLTVELDGEPADLEQFYLDLELEHNCSISKNLAYDLAVRCAQQNPYHPVKNYLNQVADKVEPIDITNLSQRYFGTIDPIYNEMMYRHLIGSVARVFDPGCKKDEAVILKGKQGILKSTFWVLLYGAGFFSDSLKGTDRDNLLILHQYWALELAEFETITSKKQAGELKAFLSASTDTFREPYARQSKARKRQSVIVGSVNPDSFLVDETGNRRYWVIPVNVDRIDVEKLATERDAIWAAAVHAYRQGERWHLTYSEEEKISQLNGDYCHTDSWEVPISNYIFNRSMVTTFEVLTTALEFDKARIGKRDEMRVANILRSLGWKKTLATYLGKRQRVWIKDDPPVDPPVDPPDQPDQPSPTLKGEVDRNSNPVLIKDLTTTDPPDQPDQPLSQTFLTDTQPPRDEDHPSHSKSLGSEVGSGGSPKAEPLNDKASEAIDPDAPPRSHLPRENQVDRPDYSTYPHLTSNDIRAKQKRANKCKKLMLACTNKEELARFRQESGFSRREIDWVYRQALTSSEQEKVKQAAAADQLNLLAPISYEWNDLLAAIDAELNRLGWTTDQGRQYLKERYGAKSRHLLTDEQIIDFWHFLKGTG